MQDETQQKAAQSAEPGAPASPWFDRLKLVQGDIAQANTEAIVNAANHELWMGSGVAGALKKAGGASIEEEALRQAPIDVGGAIITGAGRLQALHVIHAAAQAAGRPTTPEAVYEATRAALRLAAENRIESIAFPALGTGAAGLGFGDCANSMFLAFREHCQHHALPERIELWLWGDNALAVFDEALQSFMS
ncbi:macro domain-containing protein [bacterium]|nr:macro domain-containing protein [bacterium]